MTPHLLTRSLDRAATIFILVVAACGILIPLSNLLLPAGSVFQVPTYLVALWGKYVCYAVLALSIDLIWGYCGILSLGIANKFLEPVAGAVLGKIAILVLIILFIQKRPRGLFALKGRAVEA